MTMWASLKYAGRNPTVCLCTHLKDKWLRFQCRLHLAGLNFLFNYAVLLLSGLVFFASSIKEHAACQEALRNYLNYLLASPVALWALSYPPWSASVPPGHLPGTQLLHARAQQTNSPGQRWQHRWGGRKGLPGGPQTHWPLRRRWGAPERPTEAPAGAHKPWLSQHWLPHPRRAAPPPHGWPVSTPRSWVERGSLGSRPVRMECRQPMTTDRGEPPQHL